MRYNVLVFSTQNDRCVEPVLKTLEAKGLKGLRINTQEFLRGDTRTYIDILNSTTDGLIEAFVGVHEIKSVWFRRSGNQESFQYERNDSFHRSIKNFQFTEYLKLKEFFYEKLSSFKIPQLGNFNRNNSLNKLIVLRKAKEIGLNVPHTYVCNDLDYVKHEMDSKLITKAIHEAPRVFENDKILVGYTSKVDDTDMISNNIAPSLFQTYIESVFEIRTIYIFGQFFSVGYYISGKTIPDIRYYHYHRNLRKFPFKLPEEIEYQLDGLLTHFRLDFACVDLCLGNDGLLYFFEMNPGGTFSGISKAFNFGIENLIADYLSG